MWGSCPARMQVAYRFVKRGKIAAICDMNEELLSKFGDDFDVSSRYTDLDEMLEKEKPDVPAHRYRTGTTRHQPTDSLFVDETGI